MPCMSQQSRGFWLQVPWFRSVMRAANFIGHPGKVCRYALHRDTSHVGADTLKELEFYFLSHDIALRAVYHRISSNVDIHIHT